MHQVGLRGGSFYFCPSGFPLGVNRQLRASKPEEEEQSGEMLPEDPAALKVVTGEVEGDRKTRLLSPFEVVEESFTLRVWTADQYFHLRSLFGSETGF